MPRVTALRALSGTHGTNLGGHRRAKRRAASRTAGGQCQPKCLELARFGIVIVFVLYHLCRRLSRPAPRPALKAATLAPLSSLEPERDETCARAPSSGLGSSRSVTFRV